MAWRRWRSSTRALTGRPWRSLVAVVVAVVVGAFVVGALHRGGTSRAGGPLDMSSEHASASPAAGAGSGTAGASGGHAGAAAPPTITAPLSGAPAPPSTSSASTAAAQGGAGAGGATGGATAAPLPTPAGGGGQAAKIEETGALTLVVPASKIAPDLARVSTLASGHGGFVASSQLDTGPGDAPTQGTVTLQVPQAAFETVLSEAKGLGKVASLSSQATDVTGQYVDLQARISALEASRQQYLTIMAKATSIGDVLAVQNQLDSLQSQIEQLQAQLAQLGAQTTYATLAVTLTPKVLPTPVPRSGLASAWHAAVSGFVGGFEGVLSIAGPLLFALLVLAFLVAVGRGAWYLRRRSASTGPLSGAATDLRA